MKTIGNIMTMYRFKTENEAVRYVLETYEGMLHQIQVLTSGLNDAEAEIEEFNEIKSRFKEVLVDIGVLMPSLDQEKPIYTRQFRDEEE